MTETEKEKGTLEEITKLVKEVILLDPYSNRLTESLNKEYLSHINNMTWHVDRKNYSRVKRELDMAKNILIKAKNFNLF